MLRKPDPKPPDDEIKQKLRAGARKRRPVTWKGIVLLLALLLIPAALFVWWIYPRPDPPRLDVVAFDQLGLPAQEIELHAILEPTEVDPAAVNLAGYPLFFEENLAGGKGGQTKESSSGRGGLATTAWNFPEGRKRTFVVRLPGDAKRRGASDRGQVYLWPADTPLLLVDVPTLSAATTKDWQKKNPLEIEPLAAAAKALQEIQRQRFQVVYLALSAGRPLAYRKVRGWVENQVNSKNPFPGGPVLGRKSYAGDGEAARPEILIGLKEQFKGPLVAVVGHGEAAAVCRGLGIDAVLIGKDEAPKDVVRLKSWSEVPEKIAKKYANGEKK